MNDTKYKMNWRRLIRSGFGGVALISLSVLADGVLPPQPPPQTAPLPPGVTEEMLAPPPVPRFLLENSGPRAGSIPRENDPDATKKARTSSTPSEPGGDKADRRIQGDAQ